MAPMIADWQTDTVLVADRFVDAFPDLAASLVSHLRQRKLHFGVVAGLADLWIRDAAPVQTAEGRFVQFAARPENLHESDRFGTMSDAFRRSELFRETTDSALSVDGRNVVGTGRFAVLTDRIDEENPKVSPERLRDELKSLLHVRNLVVLRRERGEPNAHANCMLRFVDDRRVVVNDYREIDANYAGELERLLRLCRLDIIRMPYDAALADREGIPSTLSNYVNFLRCGQTVFLPTFECADDSEAFATAARLFGEANVVRVPCRALAEKGGELNRVAWTGKIGLAARNRIDRLA
jgi:agmatine deiminase